MIGGFLKKLAILNLALWGRKVLNYHRLSRKNLQEAPEAKKTAPTLGVLLGISQAWKVMDEMRKPEVEKKLCGKRHWRLLR